ncbi:MAG: hypothetical protein RQ743_09510 [Bacteroidales bacterium]|nr:hypothetical protein [Bacteroidales bacterium]
MALNDYPYNDSTAILTVTRQEETAWAGCLDGEGDDWWYYLEVDHKEDRDTGLLRAVASRETIWAAEYTDIGTVSYDPGTGTIQIALRDGWELQDTGEPLKIQGYRDIPLKRPSPGSFNTYRGKETSVNVEPFLYYAIHLEVQFSR